MIKLKEEDGSTEEVKLTKEEAKGFYKVWDKLKLDSNIDED